VVNNTYSEATCIARGDAEVEEDPSKKKIKKKDEIKLLLRDENNIVGRFWWVLNINQLDASSENIVHSFFFLATTYIPTYNYNNVHSLAASSSLELLLWLLHFLIPL